MYLQLKWYYYTDNELKRRFAKVDEDSEGEADGSCD